MLFQYFTKQSESGWVAEAHRWADVLTAVSSKLTWQFKSGGGFESKIK